MARKKSTKKSPPEQRPFAVGDVVRVRPGVMDPDFFNIPLGGWTGTIQEVVESAGSEPRLLLIKWNDATLTQTHPIYTTRSIRRELDATRAYLYESDLMPDDGSPVVLEQPTEIVPLPLDLDDPEDRVRAAVGLTSDDDIPALSYDNICAYHRYLSQHLTFPFRAILRRKRGRPHGGKTFLILWLLPVEESDLKEGSLQCVARPHLWEGKGRPDGELANECNRRFDVPLTDVTVSEDGANRELIEDYVFWWTYYDGGT